MTVKELIEILQKVDPEIRVLTPGYEADFDDIKVDTNISHFQLNQQTEWYYGPHNKVKEPSSDTVPAIIIRAYETNSNND